MSVMKTWITRMKRLSVILPAKVYRLFHKELWLFASRPDEADGNALTLFNWIGEKMKCVFVLNEDAPQYQHGMVKWGGLRHMFFSATATVHVFDVEETCNIISPRIRKMFGLETKQVFLQHGIIRWNIPFYHFNKKRYDLFIVSARKEYEFVYRIFGYPYDHIALTGLARYDQLLGKATDKKFVLIMPTWRKRFCKMSEEEFVSSDFYQRFQSLLDNPEFQEFLKLNNLKLCFSLHYMIRSRQKLFRLPPENLIYSGTQQVHELLRDCSVLITDCSSVAFDVALAGKPLAYYGFGEEHYSPADSYMQLDTGGFGPVLREENEVIQYIKTIWDGEKFCREKIYDRRCEEFFMFRDTNNCQRIYDRILTMEGRSKEDCQ